MPTARVNINPDVLMWAVDYSKKGLDEFLNKFPKFNNWLDKSALPTVKQLEDVAKFAYVPFGYLMLSEKPNVKIEAIKDFRTTKNREFSSTDEYSAELRDTITHIKDRQEWLHEYKKQQGYSTISFIGSINMGMKDDYIIKQVKQELNIDDNWRENIDNKEEGFKYFLNIIENNGVVVFVNGIVGINSHRKLNVNEFRGFALTDKFAPVIFINASDAPAARLFTLLHELVHLFLGQDGLDDRTEPFCNRIAAQILVPPNLFLDEWEKQSHDFDALERYFKVSQLVLYRTAFTLGKIDNNEYNRLVHLCNKKYQDNKKNSGGGDFYAVANYRFSRIFCQYVREALYEGNLAYTDAYKMFGISGKTFENVINPKSSKGAV